MNTHSGTEPRRRRHVADRLRAEGVDCRRRGKDRRAREESGELKTELAAGPRIGSRSSTPGAEDDHVVRARIAHGLQERGHVGGVLGVARRRVAGEAGFDVTYLRRRSEIR